MHIMEYRANKIAFVTLGLSVKHTNAIARAIKQHLSKRRAGRRAGNRVGVFHALNYAILPI